MIAKKTQNFINPDLSDLDIIKDMLGRKNITYSVITDEEYGLILIAVERGYSGFITEFTFTKEGEFQDIGAYE